MGVNKKISQESAKTASQVVDATDYIRVGRGAASNYKIKISELAKRTKTKNLVVEIADFTGTDYTPTGDYSLAGKTPNIDFKIFSMSGGQLLIDDTSTGGYYDHDNTTGKITIPSGAERILIEINN